MNNRLSEMQKRALLAFVITVVMAWLMRWEAGDLMWGIWASTTTYGLAYGIVLIVKNPEEVDAGDGTEKGRLFAVLAFFTGFFGVFHYGQGIFLDIVFPITPLEGWELFLYPVTALSWYWGVIITTFYSRWPELVAATKPSSAVHRILEPMKNVARMQVLVFVFMFLAAAGLIRFAVYPVLIFYFFPFPVFREKLKYWFEKWDDYMNRIPPDEFEEMDIPTEPDET